MDLIAQAADREVWEARFVCPWTKSRRDGDPLPSLRGDFRTGLSHASALKLKDRTGVDRNPVNDPSFP